MPFIPILVAWPDWVYASVGLISTGLLWWKNDKWVKGSVSLVAFIATAYAFQRAGLHECSEGFPPEILEYLAGAMAASLPWVFGKWRWMVPLGFLTVFLAATNTARDLAHSYHDPAITGNPEFSSGRFWHTPITGQLPRDAQKTREFKRSWMQEISEE